MIRLFEMIPGALAWGTLLLVVLVSWKLPSAAALFIILFDIYWFLKIVYLSLHLQHTFREMRRRMKTDWLAKLNALPADTPGYAAGRPIRWRDIHHLVILPYATEPYGVIAESVRSLAAANYPKDRMIVVLSGEERYAENARQVAERIKHEFGTAFFRLAVTTHPMALPGELPGKGANETWAGRFAKETIIDPLGLPYDQVLVSVFDCDTNVYPEYFGVLTHAFTTGNRPERASYQPIPFFTNNIYQAPAIARVIAFSATFWHMMQQARPERLTTFSSHSMPFKALVDVGFWHTSVVSEDSRVFWQCYLHYGGDWRVESLYYPVAMDANAAPTFWGTLKNLYKQQRRWGWGAENIPYMLEGFFVSPVRRMIPAAKKAYWTFIAMEGFHSWATNALIIFALGWLPVLIGGESFNYTVLSYNLPQITRFIMMAASFGIITTAVLGIVLLPREPEWVGVLHYVIYVIQWALIPFTLIAFGALPALEAQTRLMIGGRFRLGFWITPKSR